MRLLIIIALAALTAACGQPRPAKVDPAFGDNVRAYLMAHPEILEDLTVALKEKKSREAIEPVREQLERDPRDQVLNPNGKITVVELVDYNCGYCKVLAPEVLELARKHPDVRFVFKDMVIFGETSEYAAAATFLAKSPEQFVALHSAFMAARPLTDATATRIMIANGLDPEAVRREQLSPARKGYLQAVRQLALEMKLEGTPAFIVGNTLIPGADPEALKAAIAAELKRKT